MNDSENDNLTANTTYTSHDMKFKTFLSVFYVLIIIASLLGNSVVCLVMLGTRSLRQSIDTCFVLSLAVSDILTTCLVTPFDLERIILEGRWRHGEIMCNLWTTAYHLMAPTWAFIDTSHWNTPLIVSRYHRWCLAGAPLVSSLLYGFTHSCLHLLQFLVGKLCQKVS